MYPAEDSTEELNCAVDLMDLSGSLPDIENLSEILQPDLFENILTEDILLDMPGTSAPAMPSLPDYDMPGTSAPAMPSLPDYDMPGTSAPAMASLPDYDMPGTSAPAMPSPPDYDMPGTPEVTEIILSPPSPFKDAPSPPKRDPKLVDPRKRYLSSFPDKSQEPPFKKIKFVQFDSVPHSSNDPRYLPSAAVHQPPMSGAGSSESPPFKIIEDDRGHYKKYDTDARLTTLQFREMDRNENMDNNLRAMFSALLGYLPQQNVAPHDRIGLTISNSSRPDQRSIGLSLRRFDQLDADVILQTVEKVLQSNESFFVDGCLTVRFIHIKLPSGESMRNRTDLITNFHDFCRKKKSIIVINNKDKLCLARALVVARAYVHKNESPENLKLFNRLRHQSRSGDYQTREAEKLCRDAGVDLTNGGGLDEIQRFQAHLANYKITDNSLH